MLVGGILVCVLLLSGWLFIVDFGGFSHFLADKSRQSVQNEQVRFMGTWSALGYGTLSFFSDGSYHKGTEDGTWKLVNSSLFFYASDERQSLDSYRYVFTENDTVLQLTNRDSGEQILLTKQ